MSGASHIDGANPIGRVKNGNGQLSTERQDRMMVDAWSVDRDATSSFCVFVLPAIFHSRTGAEVRSRLQLCEREERSTVQGPRPGITAGTDTEIPDQLLFPIPRSSCSETRRKRIYTADSRDPDGAGASACRVYAAAGPAQTPDEREPMTRTSAASPGGSPSRHAPHPIGALRPDTCDASRKPLRVESTLRRSHSISRSTCRAHSQRLSSCPLSLSRTRSLPRTRTRRHSQRSRGWCLPG
jgi:hypothetical protein